MHLKSCFNQGSRSTGWLAAVVLVCAGELHGQSTMVRAVSSDLVSTNGQLELMDDQRVSIRQADGSTSMLNPSDIAFIEFTGTLESNVPDGKVRNGLLRLVDGTRYTGWCDVSGDRFIWLNWWSGTVQPGIDTITSFSKDGNQEQIDSDQSEDLVILGNGDRLSGLVLEITNTVEVERVDASVVTVPLDRVEQVSLVNPMVEDSGVRAWLTRGDEVKIADFRFDVGFGLRIPDREPLMPNYLYAIAFDAERITPLAAEDARTFEMPGVPRYEIPRPKLAPGAWPLDAPPITLMGPMRTEWILPEEGMGFTTTAVLPRRHRRFGDLELVLIDGNEEVKSIHLDADNPREVITIRLKSREFAIEIRESSSGPVQDHVRLERAMLIRP